MRYASLLGRLLYGAIGLLGGAFAPILRAPKPLSPNTTSRPVQSKGRWRTEPPRVMSMNGAREVARRRRQIARGQLTRSNGLVSAEELGIKKEA